MSGASEASGAFRAGRAARASAALRRIRGRSAGRPPRPGGRSRSSEAACPISSSPSERSPSKIPLLRTAAPEQRRKLFGRRAAALGLLHGPAEVVAHQACRGELLQRQCRAALFEREAQPLELLAGRAFPGQREPRAQLHAFGPEGESRQHSPSRGDASRRQQRNPHRPAHVGREDHRRGLLAAVVSAGLEPFGHDGVHARLLALAGEFRARHDVRHLAAGFVQLCRPALRVARRGEDDRHALLDDRFDDLVGIPVHERDVHAEGFPCGFAAAADMFAQQVGRHRAGADQPQAARFAHGGGQPPAAAPDHAARDDGVADSEQGADSVFHDFSSCIFFRVPRRFRGVPAGADRPSACGAARPFVRRDLRPQAERFAACCFCKYTRFSPIPAAEDPNVRKTDRKFFRANLVRIEKSDYLCPRNGD